MFAFSESSASQSLVVLSVSDLEGLKQATFRQGLQVSFRCDIWRVLTGSSSLHRDAMECVRQQRVEQFEVPLFLPPNCLYYVDLLFPRQDLRSATEHLISRSEFNALLENIGFAFLCIRACDVFCAFSLIRSPIPSELQPDLESHSFTRWIPSSAVARARQLVVLFLVYHRFLQQRKPGSDVDITLGLKQVCAPLRFSLPLIHFSFTHRFWYLLAVAVLRLFVLLFSLIFRSLLSDILLLLFSHLPPCSARLFVMMLMLSGCWCHTSRVKLSGLLRSGSLLLLLINMPCLFFFFFPFCFMFAFLLSQH